MNITQLSTDSNFRILFGDGVTMVLTAIQFGFQLLLLIAYPFYIYVHKINYTRDQMTPLFPTTNHFYEVMKPVYLLFFCSFASYGLSYHLAGNNFLLGCLISVILTVSFLLLYVIAEVCHLLVAFLAIQKLLIYFFPSIEKYAVITQNSIYKNIRKVYLFFLMKDIVATLWFVSCAIHDYNESVKWRINMIFGVSTVFLLGAFIILNSVLIISSLLYVPIMLNVSKFSYLPSFHENKPQKYILWQTIIVIIFKLGSIPSTIYLFLNYSTTWAIIINTIFCDIYLVPLIIQISYLGCNKRNVNTFMSSFTLTKFIRVLLDIKRDSEVHPSIHFTDSSNPAFV
ncbi:hypothetical protein CRE_10766 [Caenorhabditis remanei]|uniref:Serpentine Receptor, class Z n=1 Tax=Caenorhabditis remanei TaxID=31234 RepID=E3NTF1_CAERE|nr:hypothetical protein CRE_10766 [Caenorhabditis remanei]